jgi:magnesium transporter
MNLISRLGEELVRNHPERAAAVLERLGPTEAIRTLSKGDPSEAADVLRHMVLPTSVAVLEGIDLDRAIELAKSLELDVASRLIRPLSERRRVAILERLPPRETRALGALLRFPENSAGSLMDPTVMALPDDLTAKEALARVRDDPDSAHYNLYVTDRDQKLVGAMNLRELFLARPLARLSELMVRDPLYLDANDDRAAVIGHPGWKEVHSLPVVDSRRCYLGAVRYRTLRSLEQVLLGAKEQDGDATEALGELFAAGASGLLDALAGTAALKKEGR